MWLEPLLVHVTNGIVLLLWEGHLQIYLRLISTLLNHLVVAQDDAEGLANDDVEQPEQQVVCVRRYHILELSLQHHARNVDHHEEEGHKVEHTKDADHDVLVEHSTDSEGEQEAVCAAAATPAQWEVNVAQQVIVDGLVPLAPILAQVARVPPVAVEASIAELGQLSQEVQPRMEGRVEHGEPHVGGRYRHVQRREQDPHVVTLLEVRHSVTSDRHHVLVDEVEHEVVASGKLKDPLPQISDPDRWRCWVDQLIAACRRDKEPYEVLQTEVLRVLARQGKRLLVDVEESGEVIDTFCLLALLGLFDALHQQSIVVADVMEACHFQEEANGEEHQVSAWQRR